jgi:predicted kinase
MELILLCGISGSGKTTYRDKHFPDAVLASADDGMMENGIYVFRGSNLEHAHGACFRRVIEALQSRRPLVVVDNTNITIEAVAPYMSAGEAYGYKVRLLCLKLAPEIAGPRNTHKVPQAKVEEMAKTFDAFLKNLPRRWKARVELVPADP